MASPNLVFLILVPLIAWRSWELYRLHGAMPPTASNDLARSPLTLMLLGLVFGYYATYSFGLLRWRRRSAREVAAV